MPLTSTKLLDNLYAAPLVQLLM